MLTALLLAVLPGDRAKAEDATAGRTQSVVQGKAILQANCARWHAIEKTGNSPLALAPRFRDLHENIPSSIWPGRWRKAS